MSSKGVIPAFVAYGAAIVLIGAAMLLIFVFSFKNNMEITISDKIADGLSSINYFYLTEKNINEFAQVLIDITAKESGERCGGVDCYSWTGSYPSYDDLRNKFEEALRGKITGFPAQIGNGGRISFAPPRISGLEMDENNVKISMFPQQVYRKTDSFSVNSSSENVLETEKQIRYLLLAKIGQKLYGNGTYARDWGRIYVNSGTFDCDNDGTAEKAVSGKKLSEAGADGCKIMSIDFDTADISWSGMGDYCKGKQTTAYEPGVNAGRVEGGKLYVQIDNLLEYSLVCGIGGADGLASVSGSYGEVSKSSESIQPVCTEEEAGADAWQKARMEEKINAILNALSSTLKGEYAGIDVQASAKIGSADSYRSSDSQPDWTVTCGNKKPGGCSCRSDPDPARNIPQYCKTGNICGQQSSFSVKRTGECMGSCDSGGWSYYDASGELGYCCPAEYPVFDSYTQKCFSSSTETLKIEKISNVPPPGMRSACDCTYLEVTPPWYAICPINYPDCISTPSPDSRGNCGWSYSNDRTRDDYSYSCEYRGDTNEGSATISASYPVSRSSDTTTNEYSVFDSWGNSKFYEEGISEYTYGSGSKKYNYWCKLDAYFKFTFTPDISFKIIDTAGDKIVKKGTTNFDSLYFAVKFKPAEPYVMGESAAAPPKPIQGPPHPPAAQKACAETAGQACEASCSGGKTAGVGKCGSGICCKPATNTCISQSGTCDIWASCPADKPLEVPKSSIADCAESNKKCCKPQQSTIVITGEGKDIII